MPSKSQTTKRKSNPMTTLYYYFVCQCGFTCTLAFCSDGSTSVTGGTIWLRILS